MPPPFLPSLPEMTPPSMTNAVRLSGWLACSAQSTTQTPAPCSPRLLEMEPPVMCNSALLSTCTAPESSLPRTEEHSLSEIVPPESSKEVRCASSNP